jgi:hypothetical protein
MTLRRRHLFEFNDTPGVPDFVRDTVIESLSRTISWGRVLRELVHPFTTFVRSAGATEVLDIGAGAGGPAAIFVEEMLEAGVEPPKFVLTDIHPHVETWEALKRKHPRYIDYVPEPVDGSALPPELARGRVTAIINVLHHFRPKLAEKILHASLEESAGLFVIEGFERTPLGFGAFVPLGLPALLVNPLLSPRRNIAKAVFTYLTPFAIGISIWDGLVSTLRVYSEDELREMVAPLADRVAFEYGTYAIGSFGRGYYFTGAPKKG